MAKKGQKFNNHSYETKIKIVNEYLNHGGSTYSLSKKYDIPVSSIKNWIKLYKTKKEISKIKCDSKENHLHNRNRNSGCSILCNFSLCSI